MPAGRDVVVRYRWLRSLGWALLEFLLAAIFAEGLFENAGLAHRVGFGAIVLFFAASGFVFLRRAGQPAFTVSSRGVKTRDYGFLSWSDISGAGSFATDNPLPDRYNEMTVFAVYLSDSARVRRRRSMLRPSHEISGYISWFSKDLNKPLQAILDEFTRRGVPLVTDRLDKDSPPQASGRAKTTPA